MIVVKDNNVFSNNDVTISVYNLQISRNFFAIKVTLHTNIKTETICLVFDSIEACLNNANDTIYIEMDIANCELISLSQLEQISRKLGTLRRLLSQKLVATFIRCSNDTYWAKGMYGTLISFFKTLYTPVKPYEFYFTEKDRISLYTKYEAKA